MTVGREPEAGRALSSAEGGRKEKVMAGYRSGEFYFTSSLIGLPQIRILWDSGTPLIPDRSSHPGV